MDKLEEIHKKKKELDKREKELDKYKSELKSLMRINFTAFIFALAMLIYIIAKGRLSYHIDNILNYLNLI